MEELLRKIRIFLAEVFVTMSIVAVYTIVRMYVFCNTERASSVESLIILVCSTLLGTWLVGVFVKRN